MIEAGRLLGRAVLAMAISVGLASCAEAQYRKYRYYDLRYSRQYQDARQYHEARRDQNEEVLYRRELRDGERRGGRAFGGTVVELVRSCSRQAAELDRWPFDAVAQIVRPDETQRSALDDLRSSVAATVDKLNSECPARISAPGSAWLDDVVLGMETATAALGSVRPALQKFYSALDDEQKARLLLRGLPAVEAEPRAQDRSWRRERRRSAANGTHLTARHSLDVLCKQLSASLREWPMGRIERDMRLSDQQRVALYELATVSLRAADTLACPAEEALTPVGRLDTMRSRLAALGAAVRAIHPALMRFYEALDQRQRQRFAEM